MHNLDSDQQLIEHIDERIKEFHGQLNELESAIGAYFVGRKMGWKVLMLIHDRITLKKYEKILGMHFKEDLPDVGPWAHKSYAWLAVQKIKSFWKAVKGEIPGIKTQQVQTLPPTLE